MNENHLLSDLRHKAEIVQWLADIFSCFGPFTRLPSHGAQNVKPQLKNRFEELERILELCLEEKSSEEVENELASLATGLFEMRSGGIPLPLFGSWWLEGTLQGESTHQVARILQSEELEVRIETADYLPVELEFISLLYLMQATGEEEKNQALADKACTLRSEFLKTFVRPWVSQFALKANTVLDSSYWKTVVGILVIVTENDL